MAFVARELLRKRLGITTFTSDQQDVADELLAEAQGVVENEAGQVLEESTDTLRVDGSGREDLIWPRWPITAVNSVSEFDEGVETVLTLFDDYDWSESGVLTRIGACWPCGPRSVGGEITAGYATAPPDLRKIVLRMASQAWPNAFALSQETLGDHSRSWMRGSADMDLTTAEKRIISHYRART